MTLPTSSPTAAAPVLLTPIQARVLGTLMEKARTVPDSYPLTLNALQSACNQLTSRDPVMSVTESEVLEAIDRLAGRKTIVVVAHRLSTVRDCDRIFMFDKGAIIASGSYAELLAGSDAFRKLAAGAVDPPAPGVP